MKNLNRFALVVLALGTAFSAVQGMAQGYHVVTNTQHMGSGGIDYVYADNNARKIYVPRGNAVLIFDEDTLNAAGSITDTRARGVAVDPKSHHGFSSSSPVAMWDSKTLEKIKTIDIKGHPDGIMYEPLTERIYVFSHSEPNVTVIDGKDGTVAGTIDLGGAPEQAASDENGHVYVCLEDKDAIAVVDAKTLKKTGQYELQGKGGGPGGLAMDTKNHVLFATCHEPATCVILNADDGKILATLPIGNGTDGAVFNPATMEAFSSQRDGTLTVIKETSPTTFEVAENAKTKQGAKTCTLDTKKNQVILISLDRPAGAAAPAGQRQRGGRNNGPANLNIIVVGK